MVNPAHPLSFNLADPDDEARWMRVATPDTGEKLSAAYWRSFNEVAQHWRLGDIRLERCRRALQRSLEALDDLSCVYGQHRTFLQEIGRLHLEAAERILGEAARAYTLEQGEMIVRARSTRRREDSDDKAEVVKLGRKLRDDGIRLREITGIVATRMRMSDDVVRPVLQRAGVIKPKKVRKPQK
ncbi:hypothetical protein [Pseudoxanthomonas sp. JBR18]|uniref:hypothetical protein n=1 Tax=Pseudoxanthomonas sp. JBR18 TaxID=2969308 RepID=UPI0023062548|nr:hypothetical protein [Pseudoxanthomonas sp. JBR18]WCE03166.1 hypothetical protein PJ250_13705 [Pseudoxanthomonas sp. JBR18]